MASSSEITPTGESKGFPPPAIILSDHTPLIMTKETRELTALLVGGTAAILVLPACFISPVLVLGTAAVTAVSLPFWPSNR